MWALNRRRIARSSLFRHLRRSPPIIDEHARSPWRVGSSFYPSTFRFLAGQLASARRSFPAAPVDLDPPAPSRRLIVAPINRDWCCLVAPGRGGETIVIVDVDAPIGFFVDGPTTSVLSVIWMTESHVAMIIWYHYLDFYVSRHVWFCFPRVIFPRISKKQFIVYCLSLISWLNVELLLPNEKKINNICRLDKILLIRVCRGFLHSRKSSR
jgi:hypothetical protein